MEYAKFTVLVGMAFMGIGAVLSLLTLVTEWILGRGRMESILGKAGIGCIVVGAIIACSGSAGVLLFEAMRIATGV